MVKVLVLYGPSEVYYGEMWLRFDGAASGRPSETHLDANADWNGLDLTSVCESDQTIVVNPADASQMALAQRILLHRKYRSLQRAELEFQLEKTCQILDQCTPLLQTQLKLQDSTIRQRHEVLAQTQQSIATLQESIRTKLPLQPQDAADVAHDGHAGQSTQ